MLPDAVVLAGIPALANYPHRHAVARMTAQSALCATTSNAGDVNET